MLIFSTGLVRGILSQITGTLLGMGLVMLVRLLMGLPAWNAEPVMVGGITLGGLTSLWGSRCTERHWIKWARGIPAADHPQPDPNKPQWFRYLSADTDHKVIGCAVSVCQFFHDGVRWCVCPAFPN